MWLVVLSDQLPVIATVGRHPTVELIGRRALQAPRVTPGLLAEAQRPASPWGLTTGFPALSPAPGQVPHVLLTRPPRSRGLRRARPTCMH